VITHIWLWTAREWGECSILW